MENSRFYTCKHCKNLVGMIKNGDVPIYCCGEPMINLTPNDSEGLEKHKPTVCIKGDSVEVNIGKTPHPMSEDHHIDWVYLQTDIGGQRKALVAGSDPSLSFKISNENVVSVYAYCNKHGLFRTIISH